MIILVLKIKLILLNKRNLLSIVLFSIFVSVVRTPVVWHELVVVDDAQHWYTINLLQHNNIQCYCLLYHCIIFMLTQKYLSNAIMLLSWLWSQCFNYKRRSSCQVNGVALIFQLKKTSDCFFWFIRSLPYIWSIFKSIKVSCD